LAYVYFQAKNAKKPEKAIFSDFMVLAEKHHS